MSESPHHPDIKRSIQLSGMVLDRWNTPEFGSRDLTEPRAVRRRRKSESSADGAVAIETSRRGSHHRAKRFDEWTRPGGMAGHYSCRRTDFDIESILLLTASEGEACHAFEIESLDLEGETIRGRVSINRLNLQDCPVGGIGAQDRCVFLSALLRVTVGQNEPTAAVVKANPSAGERKTWKTRTAGA